MSIRNWMLIKKNIIHGYVDIGVKNVSYNQELTSEVIVSFDTCHTKYL